MRRLLKIIVVVSALLSLSCCKKKTKIVTNPTYAIGTINNYVIPRIGNGYEICFSYYDAYYTISGKEYSICYYNGDNGWCVPKGNYNSGDKYMVVYDYNNPQQAACMLFNYPVRDSTDYKNYVNKFKSISPNYCMVTFANKI